MRVTKAAACAAVGLMLLAGCSKSDGPATNTASGAPGAPAAAAPASGPDTAITVADMPHPKAGYWETATTTNGGELRTVRACSSGKPYSPAAELARSCPALSYKRTFMGAIVIDANCAEGPVTSKLHTTVSGDFNSSFTTDSQVSIVMQGKPASSFTTHSAMRYLGACPAGSVPHDG